MKRIFDVIFAFAVLLVSWPVYLIVIVGILISSRGPVLYRARRVGRGGKEFYMMKFRSMHVARSGPVITSTGDPRVFMFGHFIRKLKFDELPQFLNVIKGDMSIVGPRPEDPIIVDIYYTSWMRETLNVHPGITSPGSVFYYSHGEFLVDPESPEKSYGECLLPLKLAIELGYIQRATFWTDLGVIFRTIVTILRQMVGCNAVHYDKDITEAARWVPVEKFGNL